MKEEPENLVMRNLYWTKRKQYKVLTKQAKQKAVDRFHKQILGFRKTSHQKFWNIILKARNVNRDNHIPIPAEIMKEYFEGLLNRPSCLSPTIALPAHNRDDSLDELINEDEIRLAIRRSKCKKAPGIDGIPTETLKLFDKQLLLTLKTIFNRILTDQLFPESWSVGIIKPIYKSGDRQDPSNYRGITLLPIMGKVFTKIIRDRIEQWAEDHNKLNNAQFGFRSNRRTIDAIFVLSNIIEMNKKRRQPVFACFVDFAKAFDTVDHSILWQKLFTVGLSTKMLNLLQDMYSKASAVVKIDTEVSNPFSCSTGVRQGCNLSPLLFILFLSDLEEHMKVWGAKGILMSNLRVNILMFADDVVLLAETAKDMNSSLAALSRYCLTSNLKVNANKTRIVVFNRIYASPRNNSFVLNGCELQPVREYKYLGLVMKESGDINLQTLAGQAKKALFSLKSALQNLNYPNPKIMCHLFDSLVCPVLEYGCEVWGFSQVDSVEIVHRNFCKFALGVPSSTTNLACYGELARPPLLLKRKLRILKYWLRIVTNWQIPSLVYDAYCMARNSSLKWAVKVKSLLNSLGFSECWLMPDLIEPSTLMQNVKERLMDQFIQEWRTMLSETAGKLRTYKLFKSHFEIESYLNLPVHLRVPLTKFRVSAHALRIETGRYNRPHKLALEERLCWFCKNTVEDEMHFLLECPLYSENRQVLMRECVTLNKSFVYFSTADKFSFLLGTKSEMLQYALARFIKISFQTRQAELEDAIT